MNTNKIVFDFDDFGAQQLFVVRNDEKVDTLESLKEVYEEGKLDEVPEDYYPTSIENPIHTVNNWMKVIKAAIDQLEGAEIPAIYTHEGSQINGVHRAATNDLLKGMDKEENLIPVKDIADTEISEELQAAIEEGDFEAINDLLDR